MFTSKGVAGRALVAWVNSRRLSNSLSADFCIDAVEDAIATYGCPAIFNTDQARQFTSFNFVDMLRADEGTTEATHFIGRYIAFYNQQRPHSSLGGQTPDTAYFNQPIAKAA